MYGYWPSVSSFKSTHVSIGGVEGLIWRDGPDWPYDTGQYLFSRKESGKSVPIVNPVDVHVIGAGYDWYSDNYVSSKDFSRGNTILWPFGPNVPQTPHELAADIERDSIRSILDNLYSIPGGSGEIILLYSAPINNGINDSDYIESEVYKGDFSEIYYDFAADFKRGLPVLPPFKTWLGETYPEVFFNSEIGWEAPIESYQSWAGNLSIIPKTNAARSVNLTTRLKPGSLQPGTYDDIPTQLVDNTHTDLNSKVGCKLGITVGENGLISSTWVHQGGLNYTIGDLLTIPAGAIGNRKTILLSVEETHSEVIGTVYDKEGNIDTSLSYSEFDLSEGYLPRSALIDSVHLNSFGTEYLNLLLAYRLIRLNSNGSSIDVPHNISAGETVAFLSADLPNYSGKIVYELVNEPQEITNQLAIEGNRLIAATDFNADAGVEFSLKIQAKSATGPDIESDIFLRVYNRSLDIEHPFPLNATYRESNLILTFNEDLAEKSFIRNRFVVTQGRQRLGIKGINPGTDQKSLHLTLNDPLDLPGTPIRIAYKGYKLDKKNDVVEDTQGNDLLPFSGFEVSKYFSTYISDEHLSVKDLDENGLVDGSENLGYQLMNGEQSTSLFTGLNQSVEFISSSSSSDWEVVAAQPFDQGFNLLLEGKDNHIGYYAEWSVAKDGRITTKPRNTQWKTLAEISLTTNWENELGEDINGDDLIGRPQIEAQRSDNLIKNIEPTKHQPFRNNNVPEIYPASNSSQAIHNNDEADLWSFFAGASEACDGFYILEDAVSGLAYGI